MTTDKKQITRNRTSYSCQLCRRRKVRCDKQHPRCGGCAKANEVCVYGDPDNTELTQPFASIDLGRKRRATGNDGPDEDGGGEAGTAFQSIERQLSQLTSLVHASNRLTPISVENSPGGRQARLSSTQESVAGHEITKEYSPDRTSLNGTLDRSTGQGDPWEKVLGRLESLNVLLRDSLRTQFVSVNHGPTDTNISPPQSSGPTNPFNQHATKSNTSPSSLSVPGIFSTRFQNAHTERDMLAPSEEQHAVLFRNWLWSVYPILPIVSPSVVLDKYQAFHHWYRHGLDKGDPNTTAAFMPLFVLIWYTGYTNLSERAKRRWFRLELSSNSTWMRTMHGALESYLEIMKSEAIPSVHSLTAAIYSQALAIGGQDMMRNHVSNTLNLRAAQSLGIHHERTLKDLRTPEAEMRRRLWWEALTTDAAISTVSGMPVILDERYTDVKAMSDLKESCMDTQDAVEYQAHLEEPGSSPDRPDDPANWQTSSLVSVYHLVTSARHMLTTVTKKVLKANMSASRMTIEELRVVRKSMHTACEEVRKVIIRIQTRGIPELDFVPDTTPPSEVDHLDMMGEDITTEEINYFLRQGSTTKGSNPIMKHHRSITIAFHKWARIMLSMSIDRLDCISYAPFLKNSKSRLWAVARNCALRSCHGYMRKFLCLAEDPELRVFRWAWISSFHPMHATIIMLIDVHDRPHSDEAPRSRAMIDKIFSLISLPRSMDFPQFASVEVLPLKEGGEEAWTMLRKLRHKAWQNAGLDPDVLWTEEDQMSVGVGKPLRENDLFIRSLRENIISRHKQRKDREDGRVSGHTAPIFTHPHFEATKKQRFHPSEVGQGDQISGSVVREIADLDSLAFLPQILLLRARNDQELMPYPVIDTGRAPQTTATNDKAQHNTTNYSSSQPTKDIQVLHIGELIQKIQQSKRANKKDNSTLSTHLQTSSPKQPLPSEPFSEAHPSCDFRTVRSVENAAYQAMSDDGYPARSMVPITSIDLGNPTDNVQPSVVTTCLSDMPLEHDGGSSDPSLTGYQLVPQSRDVMCGGRGTSSSLPSSVSTSQRHDIFTSANGHSHTYQDESQPMQLSRQQQQQQYLHEELGPNQHAQELNPKMNDSSTTTTEHSIAMDMEFDMNTDTDANVDFDFDWARWDELFGSYAGFAEMLMDDSGENQAENHHGEGHELVFN